MSTRISDRLIVVALAIAFLIPSCTVIGIGYLSLKKMERFRLDAKGIADSEWRDVELANEALRYSNENTQIDMRIVVTTNDTELQSLLEKRGQNSTRISALIEVLQTRVGSEQEGELLENVIQTRNAYLDSYRSVTSSYLQHRHSDAAKHLLADVTSPLAARYQRAWKEFVQFQADEVSQHLRRSVAEYSVVKKRTEYFVCFSLLLGVVTATFVIRTTATEMCKRAIAESEIHRVNLRLEADVLKRTAALSETNQKLLAEVAERKSIEDSLSSKTALLEAQLDSTNDGILVVDAHGKVALFNERFVALRNIPKELVDQKDDRALLDFVTSTTKHPQRFLEKVQYLYREPYETSSDEVEFVDGMVIDRYSSPVIGKDGKYFGRIWTFRDITQRKRNEDTLLQLSSAVEQSPVLIVITDPTGNISYVNRKFTECTGYTLEEVVGRRPSMLKSGYTSPESYRKLWETITRGGEWRGEFRNRKKNGELYWESAVITPVKDAQGNISHYLAVKEDITQQKLLEAQLRQAQKLEAIGQLAAGIAHEINTPAQYVGDNTNFLKESWTAVVSLLTALEKMRPMLADKLPADLVAEFLQCWNAADVQYLQKEVPKAIDQSLDGIQRVTKIVRAMKAFSHPGSEEKQAVNINNAVETTVTVARNEWKYVAELETRLDGDLPLVPCHAAEFNQVLLNLLVNSAHAIAEVVGDGSKGKGKILIETRRVGEWAEVAIRDTGRGIPPDAQPRIFEPFFTTKPIGKGTGQGLALAHNTIVKQHGGKIWFETEVNHGTTFFIRLPLAMANGQAAC